MILLFYSKLYTWNIKHPTDAVDRSLSSVGCFRNLGLKYIFFCWRCTKAPPLTCCWFRNAARWLGLGDGWLQSWKLRWTGREWPERIGGHPENQGEYAERSETVREGLGPSWLLHAVRWKERERGWPAVTMTKLDGDYVTLGPVGKRKLFQCFIWGLKNSKISLDCVLNMVIHARFEWKTES